MSRSTGSIEWWNAWRLRGWETRYGRCWVCTTAGQPAARASRAPSQSSAPVPTWQWKTSAGCLDRNALSSPANSGLRGDGSGSVLAPSSAARLSIRCPPVVGRTIRETSAAGAYSAIRSSMCAPMPEGSIDGV
jgi:hypothetical protein